MAAFTRCPVEDIQANPPHLPTVPVNPGKPSVKKDSSSENPKTSLKIQQIYKINSSISSLSQPKGDGKSISYGEGC